MQVAPLYGLVAPSFSWLADHTTEYGCTDYNTLSYGLTEQTTYGFHSEYKHVLYWSNHTAVLGFSNMLVVLMNPEDGC